MAAATDRRIVVVLALLLALASSSTLAAMRAITHEDVWLMRRIAAPLPSPDGRQLLLTIAEPSYDPDGQVVDLWLLDVTGSGPARRITSSLAAETTPAWSPDSRRIAFSAKREGDAAAQIYLLDLAGGGEALAVTRISTGARSPQFAPDGRSLLFVSAVHPQGADDAAQQRLAAERKARKAKVRVYTRFPIRNWDKWLDEELQLRLFVQPLEGERQPARDLLAGSQLVRQPGYGGRFTDTAEELDAVWAPDGQSIVFAASSNRDAGARGHTHSDLYQVALAGGEPRRLTGGDGLTAADSWSKPRFAPDGRTLYALVEPRTDKVYNAARIGGLDWPGLAPRPRISGPEGRAVTSFALAPDGRTLYFLAEEDGHERLWQSGTGRSARVRRLGKLERGVFANLAAAERVGRGQRLLLVANHDSASSAPEIVRIDPDSGEHRVLTTFNRQRSAGLDLPPVEHFWNDGPRGQRIHSLLVKPAGFDPQRRYPLVVLLHGGPHGMWRDTFFVRWNYHLLAGSEFVLLLTNYTGSTGFGEAFAQGIQGDPFQGPADEINAAADAAIARYPFIDGSRQCAGGASYGGHLANWLQGTTRRYRCLVSHAGLVNLESQWGSSDTVYSREANSGGPPWEQGAVWREQNPIRLGANFATPTLVSIGELDYRVPLNNSIEYWSALMRQQVESRLLVFPDENHWILKGENSRFFYAEVDAWLKRWLLDPGVAPAAAEQ